MHTYACIHTHTRTHTHTHTDEHEGGHKALLSVRQQLHFCHVHVGEGHSQEEELCQVFERQIHPEQH